MANTNDNIPANSSNASDVEDESAHETKESVVWKQRKLIKA